MPLEPTTILDTRPIQRLRGRLRLGGRCPRCGYDLSKHTGVQCPECGFVLAAELVASEPSRTLNTSLWLHRAIAAAATLTVLAMAVRLVIAWLKSTPRPELKALVPLTCCIAIWVLYEWSHAYLPERQKKGIARVLLTLFSIIALGAAWRWL